MKHVCIVTSAHPWDDVRVGSRIASTFVDAGYRVTWVGPDLTVSANRDVRQSGIDYRLFEPVAGRLGRLTGGIKAIRQARQVTGVDWWYTPDPDVAGRLPDLARRNGGKTLFDIHESYHQGLLNRWFPGTPPNAVREALRRRIARSCSRLDLVMGVSQGVLEPYCAGRPNTIVVRNLAPDFFRSDLDDPQESTTRGMASGPMRMLHGKVSAGNGTLQVSEAVGLLPPDVQSQMEMVMLDVPGTPNATKAAVLAKSAELAHSAVSVIPGVPHEEMASLMAGCSVGLIAYQRDLGHDSLPNRLFEYMAAGVAVLAPSYSPEIVRILDAEGAGITADFEVPSDIARAITWCVENPDEVAAMGVRAKAAYRERYTWGSEAERLLQVMWATDA